MEEKPKPKAKYKAGAYQVAVWENQRESEDGSKYTVQNISLVKKVKTKEGWDDKTIHINGRDVHKVVALLQVIEKNLNVEVITT